MPRKSTSPTPSKTSPATKARRKRVPAGGPSGPAADAPHSPAVLVLSGGAPNGALTAGALAAIYKRNKTFTTLYTSGAGALVGMLYKAPKGMPADKALEQLKAFGIEDDIYRLLPVGYKTFFKDSPLLETWLSICNALKVSDSSTYLRRMYNDVVDLWGAATLPAVLTPFSRGLCAPPPFTQRFVDFDLLNSQNTPGRFFMNAYCIETGTMVEFDRSHHSLTPAHFQAALSYPFIYSPTEIDDKHYFEGGCFDPLNLSGLAHHIESKEIAAETVVLIDILGAFKKSLVRVPRNLWDAYGISIMLPVVALAELNETMFRERISHINQTRPPGYQLRLVKLEFDIAPDQLPFLADWSRSNMENCWDAGWKAGQAFVDAYGKSLPDRRPGDDSSEPWFAADMAPSAMDDLLNASRLNL